MIYAVSILLVVANAACLLFVALGLPGNWLMVILTSLVAWAYWDVPRMALPSASV